MNQRDSAIFAILTGVHQRMQSEIHTVEGLLRMLVAQDAPAPEPTKPRMNFLGAEEPATRETESK